MIVTPAFVCHDVSIHVSRIVHCRRGCSEQKPRRCCFSSFLQHLIVLLFSVAYVSVSVFAFAYRYCLARFTCLLFPSQGSSSTSSPVPSKGELSAAEAASSGVLNLKLLFARLVLCDYFHICRFVVFLPFSAMCFVVLRERVTLAAPLARSLALSQSAAAALALALRLDNAFVYAGTRVWG